MKVIVAGGGIGGLTAALCCHHFGHDVVVVERADALSEIGAGIQLSPNAMKVFQALGLMERLTQIAFEPEAIETRMGVSGRVIFRVPIDRDVWGAPYLHIHRADLITVLAEALNERTPNALQLGAAAESYEQSEQGVSLKCLNGASFLGDVLIGADGIKSVIRQNMMAVLGQEAEAARFTGNVAWRCTVPAKALKDLPPATATAWVGRGKHAVTYRIRGGELINFVGVVEQRTWSSESWTSKGEKLDLLADFVGWDPVILGVLKACDPEQVYKWALYDREPQSTWTEGRVALLGDAVHPMLPFMAQGAAMAIEDGWALAKTLSASETSVEPSLLNYQNLRSPRTRAIQNQSSQNAKTFHRKTAISQLATYGPMWVAGRMFPKVIQKKLSRVYGYDPL